MRNLEQYYTHLSALALTICSVVAGRWSVTTPNHQQECAPEIEALEVCGRQVSALEQTQTQAEGRGLERCVQRERENCEARIRATEEAGSHLDCIICRQRCPDGSIP